VTELAYLTDMPAAYVREFRARVVSLPPGAVVLDRTYFYPTGGGQPNDRGVLGAPGSPALEVTDVTRSGLSVVHRVKGPSEAMRALVVGHEVDGRIDWARRYTHMRLHTAQHLLSALLFARTGLRTRRANLSGTGATIDLERPLPTDLRPGIESEFRAARDSDRGVRIRLVPRAEWDRLESPGRSGLVPLPPQADPVRVIEIEGFDLCPCGGTHVRATGEIGPVEFLAPTAPGTPVDRVAFRLVAEPRPTRAA
jgi:misacylated tRNA(Ala) deacylase